MIQLRLALAICFAALVFAAPASAQKFDPNEITEAHFVKFEPILMSVLQDRRIRGLVQLEVTIKLEDPSEWDKISRLRAQLHDRLTLAIGGMTHGAIRVDRPLNVPLVTAVLQKQIDQALGPNRASVLIVDASTRRQ